MERDPGRRYVVASKSIKQQALDGGIVKQLVLDQQPRRDVGVQNPRPDLDGSIGDLADLVQNAVGHIAICHHGRYGTSWFDWWRLDDDQAGEIIDLLRKKVTNVGGDSDRIGEQVIDRRQTRAGAMSPRGHLD